MGLKDTVVGWLRQDQAGDAKLEKAEADLVEHKYSEAKADGVLDSQLGSSGDHFDADASAPR